MTRTIDFSNGRPKDADSNICDECGRPVHPSLDCKRCNDE